ncbi:hypothetical protein [Fodinicola feengrottensis]|uniref:hypothetical protein n=1 Tax=Fodinicola feengrottensis TaxID=435914 RepID=UPI0013D49092|nr:hypothetical protein [Fodinicola feengrottensis]
MGTQLGRHQRRGHPDLSGRQLPGWPGRAADESGDRTSARPGRLPLALSDRVAPYSYDWIDHWGRRSPRILTPGAEKLAAGQQLMVFTLVDIEPGHQFSGRSFPAAERLFGPLAGTYAIEPLDDQNCRLICRLVLGSGRFGATLLAWGDFVMMRRQLLNLKGLAERDARTLAGFGAMTELTP